MPNNSKNVFVGKPVSGAIQTAPIGTTAPTDAGTTLPSATWEDSGFIDEAGLTMSQSRSTTDLKAWGGTTVRSLLDTFDSTLKWAELETTPTTMKRMVGANNVVVTAATADHGTQMKVNISAELPEARAWVFNMKDGDRRLRVYVPNGQITEVGDTTFVHNAAVKWDFTLKCLDDGTGNTIYIFTDDGQVLSDSNNSAPVITDPTTTTDTITGYELISDPTQTISVSDYEALSAENQALYQPITNTDDETPSGEE